MEFENILSERNLRWGCTIYFWVEAALAVYILGRQKSHVENGKWPVPGLDSRFHGIYNEQTFAKAKVVESEHLTFEMKLRLIYASAWSVVIHSDIIPFVWGSFESSVFDFQSSSLSLEVRRNIFFGFWIGVIEIIIQDIPNKMAHMTPAYGKRKMKSLVYIAKIELEETAMQLFQKSVIAFLHSFSFINFYDLTEGMPGPLRYFLLAICYSIALIGFELLENFMVSFDSPLIPFTREVVDDIPEQKGLYDKIAHICHLTGYKMENVYIEDEDPEFPINAYCVSHFGLYTIVSFYSSMLDGYFSKDEKVQQGLTPREIEGIMCHEVGHWARWHNELKAIFMDLFYLPLILILGICLKEYPELYTAFHFPESDIFEPPFPLLPGLFIANNIVLKFITAFFECAMNIESWFVEADADAFTVPLGYGPNIQEGIARIKAVREGFPSSDIVYTLFYDHHPTLVDRIRVVDEAASGR